MNLSKDELRALGFIALLIVLASAARVLARPEAVLPGEAGLDVAALEAASRAALEGERERERPLEEGERLDPNRAAAESLDRLPGVGPGLARRIVEDRERAGPFRRPEELTRVVGIGEKTAARLAPYLDFGVAPPPSLGARARRAPASRAPASRTPAGRTVVLNTASPAELESLPGVGPVLAARIVAYRDSAGAFGSVEELERVSGVGPATLERLRERLAVW